MQVVLNAPQSFNKLSIQERENLIQELQEELKIRTEMIEGFKKPVEDFEDWEKLGFEIKECQQKRDQTLCLFTSLP